jgi:hypothetical protein
VGAHGKTGPYHVEGNENQSDVSILDVSAQGMLRAVAPGNAEITASVDDLSAQVPASVIE